MCVCATWDLYFDPKLHMYMYIVLVHVRMRYHVTDFSNMSGSVWHHLQFVFLSVLKSFSLISQNSSGEERYISDDDIIEPTPSEGTAPSTAAVVKSPLLILSAHKGELTHPHTLTILSHTLSCGLIIVSQSVHV